MTEINLLPWRRAQKHALKNKLIGMVLSSLSITMVIAILLTEKMNARVKNQLQRNEQLTHEIDSLDLMLIKMKRINQTKSIYLSRLKRMVNLYNDPIIFLHIFQDISRILPPNLRLHSLRKIKRNVRVAGYATSHQEIGFMMHAISQNKWISHATLIEIKSPSVKHEQHHRFKLNITLLKAPIED